MYYMFMGSMQIPIPPKELTTKINNKNKTYELVSAGEINVLKQAGLTDISFTIMLPNSDYPFNQSLFEKRKASYYLDKIKKLKTSKKPFQFIVVRMKGGGELLYMSNIKVSLEEYTIEEDADFGYDAMVTISLKQYKEYGTKRIEITTDENGNKQGVVTSTRSTDGRSTHGIATANQGTTLQRMTKAVTGTTNGIFDIASANGIAIPSVLEIGKVVKF